MTPASTCWGWRSGLEALPRCRRSRLQLGSGWAARRCPPSMVFPVWEPAGREPSPRAGEAGLVSPQARAPRPPCPSAGSGAAGAEGGRPAGETLSAHRGYLPASAARAPTCCRRSPCRVRVARGPGLDCQWSPLKPRVSRRGARQGFRFRPEQRPGETALPPWSHQRVSGYSGGRAVGVLQDASRRSSCSCPCLEERGEAGDVEPETEEPLPLRQRQPECWAWLSVDAPP